MERAGRARTFGAAFCAGLVLLAAAPATAPGQDGMGAVPAAPGPEGSVLFIDGAEPTRPAALLINRGFRKTLAELAPAVTVYHEAPDLIRFRGEEQAQLFREYLLRRYRGRKIDVIVAAGDPATEFLLAWDKNPWPQAPIVAGVVEPRVAARARSRPGVTGFVLAFDLGATLDAARALLPGTRRVVLVSGRDPYDDRMDTAVAERAEVLESEWLRNLTLEETRRRLAALESDSVVVYSGIWVDGAGRPFTPQSALDQIAPAASRPIFSYNETFLGHGIVGGAIIDNERAGAEAARLAVRLLSGEPPSSIPLYELRTTRLMFDARQLDRWDLSEDRLPPGSQVLFRTPSLWREHRATVTFSAAALMIQSAFIAALLLEVRHRRRVQAELRESSAKLITAQEDERSRIARELHDDVCQRLALLALEAEMLAPEGCEPAEGRRLGAGRLAEQTRTISSDVHRIAHELHPAILDQLGLLPALRHFAEELARRQGLRIDFDERGWPSDAPRDVQLAFYRVAQEALQNVAKHSGAREARVALEATRRELSLRVTDAGRGFDPSSMRGAGLGLASMTARLRQVGGRLVVESAPERGTTVRAAIAREESAS